MRLLLEDDGSIEVIVIEIHVREGGNNLSALKNTHKENSITVMKVIDAVRVVSFGLFGFGQLAYVLAHQLPIS